MKSGRNPRPQRASRHRKRMWGMQVALLASLGLVAVRLQFVQQVFGPKLLASADQVQQNTVISLAPRGALLDSTGHLLAYDVPAFMFDVKTDAFSDLPQLADQLSPMLGVPASKILPVLQSGSTWVQWPTPILEPAKEQIQTFMNQASNQQPSHSQDVTFTVTEQRFYPYGNFAANTLGYVNQQGVGEAGLEAQYNQVMSGKNGQISFVRDGEGFPLQRTLKVIHPALPGEDVQLTIDQTVQGFVENAMNKLVTDYNPEHAAIIVMNPNTGAILGMASRPTFNPNQYWAASSEALSNNYAVNSAFEPGSTFKVMVLAAALATHVITLQDTFESGSIAVAGRVIHDWNWFGWGKITFEKALEYSSNVGFATIALKLGWPALLHYMQGFGYLDKTGIDLPAEASSIMFPPSSQGPVQLATSGFGQGIAVTPLQQMAAVAAIANGGKLMKPYLAKAFLNSATGKVVQTVQPTVMNPQVVPPDVVQQVSHAMVLDVSQGIDAAGYLKGYDVAGKTGTAQAVDPATGQYYNNRYIVSFIGYAPGWDPQIEVFVTVYWPKTKPNNQWGSTVATPTARDILQQCLQYYHIQPNGATSKALTPATSAVPATKYVQTPDLSGKTAVQAAALLQSQHLTPGPVGGTGMVRSQWPAAGVEVPVGSTLYFYAPLPLGKDLLMPNLRGASMREAGDILASVGLTMVPSGNGFAVGQSVPAGQLVPPGSHVDVTFQAPVSPANLPNGVTGPSTTSSGQSGVG